MREIVEEEAFKKCVQELRLNYKRLDEAMSAVCLALSRRPENFPMVLGTHISRARILASLGVPECDVWFTYDNRRVRLIHIELLPE